MGVRNFCNAVFAMDNFSGFDDHHNIEIRCQSMSAEIAKSHSPKTATLIGFSAILMWAFLALLGTASGPIPPFQLTAMAFLLGGLTGVVSWTWRPHAVTSLNQNWRVWLTGTFGLCVYHCLYFFAIQNAPPVEASLIAYLWPLLIVLFAALLPGETLRSHHIFGAILGLVGAVVIITKGGAVGLSAGLQSGHIYALACAFIWSGYSVLSRRFGDVPTDVVAGFCLITAVVSGMLHLALETTVWPASSTQWVAILVLGLLPLGIGFYTWDYGVKKGDIMVLGAASYAAPLLSTLVLLAAGFAAYHWTIALACLLITSGAVIAAKDMIFKRSD
jgi:drug/metabolite transporter (DMT)-like permease